MLIFEINPYTTDAIKVPIPCLYFPFPLLSSGQSNVVRPTHRHVLCTLDAALH